MEVSYRVPPSGPALNDHATQLALRRYRSGAWLLVGAGLVLLGVAVASAVQSLPEPGALLDNLDNFVTVGSLGVGLLLVSSGLISSVNARRWSLTRAFAIVAGACSAVWARLTAPLTT